VIGGRIRFRAAPPESSKVAARLIEPISGQTKHDCGFTPRQARHIGRADPPGRRRPTGGHTTFPRQPRLDAVVVPANAYETPARDDEQDAGRDCCSSMQGSHLRHVPLLAAPDYLPSIRHTKKRRAAGSVARLR
jgi:hypothetical protein